MTAQQIADLIARATAQIDPFEGHGFVVVDGHEVYVHGVMGANVDGTLYDLDGEPIPAAEPLD